MTKWLVALVIVTISITILMVILATITGYNQRQIPPEYTYLASGHYMNVYLHSDKSHVLKQFKGYNWFNWLIIDSYVRKKQLNLRHIAKVLKIEPYRGRIYEEYISDSTDNITDIDSEYAEFDRELADSGCIVCDAHPGNVGSLGGKLILYDGEVWPIWAWRLHMLFSKTYLLSESDPHIFRKVKLLDNKIVQNAHIIFHV